MSRFYIRVQFSRTTTSTIRAKILETTQFFPFFPHINVAKYVSARPKHFKLVPNIDIGRGGLKALFFTISLTIFAPDCLIFKKKIETEFPLKLNKNFLKTSSSSF